MILACISFPQFVLSQLKCLHSALSPLAMIQSYPSLPTLLAVLKSNAVTGLPGQTKVVATIQPPLSIPPALLPTQHQSSSTKQKPQSVAGPQGRKKQHKNKSREKGTSSSSSVSSEKKDKSDGLTPDHSSDSDTASSSSASSLTSSVGRKERVRRLPLGNESPHYTSSDSELSDSEPAPNRLKLAYGKIRYQAHSCLTLIFQVISLFPSLSLSLSLTHTHTHTHIPVFPFGTCQSNQLLSLFQLLRQISFFPHFIDRCRNWTARHRSHTGGHFSPIALASQTPLPPSSPASSKTPPLRSAPSLWH